MLSSNVVMAIAQSHNVAAWDGSRIKAFFALVIKYAPQLLPLILPLFGVASADDEKVSAAPDVELSAADWKAIIALLLQIFAAWSSGAEPSDGPVA